MKAILMSIRSPHTCNILNLIKLWEIRKKFPKDYVGWVYIYCTKGGDMVCYRPNFDGYACVPNLYGNEYFNGKVVARFWCDKVEEINIYGEVVTHFSTEKIKEDELLKKSCLSYAEMFDYFDNCENGYAIHITKLEIFDKPKELSEFRKPMEYTKYCNRNCSNCDYAGFNNKTRKWEFECSLTCAPQSWCYVEV